LKERLSRARPKDSTLDYAQRRGMDAARAQGADKEQAARRNVRSRNRKRSQKRKPEAGQGDAVARFKQAQKEFIQVAGELREKMKRASQEIARDPARMRAAEREGIAPQVRNFVRQAEQESGRGREKGRGSRRTKG
jgi:uncharacterized protein YukE